MQPSRALPLAALACLSLVLAACSSSAAPAVTPGTGSAAAAGETPPAAAVGGNSGSLGDPVQLSFDPCSLITPAEAKTALGVDVTAVKTDNGGGGMCNYVGVGSPSHLFAALPATGDCKLLFLQIDSGLFGDVQQRIDGIGDGGMLVAGEGNLQIAVHHGCFELDGATATGPLPDATMLDLARTAVARVP